MKYVLLLLLLPRQNDGTTGDSPEKRSTDDSFSINIGAGYGLGLDHNSFHLPDSTTQLNSTNFFPGILKNEAVIGHPLLDNDNLLNVDVDTVNSNVNNVQAVNLPVRNNPNLEETKKGVMDLKELQQIIHNVDNNSEYSKIVQVVKVPAVYEIHLEKVSQNQAKPTKSRKQYNIHQINDLIGRPKKNILSKNPIGYKKSKEHINIDEWRAERDKADIQKFHNPLKVFQPYNGRPVYMNTVKKNREKAHPNLVQPKFHPFHQPNVNPHMDIYGAPQTNVFSYQSTELPPTKPIYSTLTYTLPYNLRRAYQERSEVIPDDLVYGSQKEKVLNPGEINITMQPGTTIVKLPKLGSENQRNFIEDESPTSVCQKGRSLLKPIGEKSGITNVDDVYFTTVRPMQKRSGFRDRPLLSKKFYRRSDSVPMKYVLYINKITHHDW